jgi:hypothetical protein
MDGRVMLDTKKYHCRLMGAMTLTECGDCDFKKRAGDDDLARAWKKEYPSRLLCKQRNMSVPSVAMTDKGNAYEAGNK